MNVQFTTEDLENIRIVMSQKAKSVKNNLENLKSKDIEESRKNKIIAESEQYFANYQLIEAKCMRQLSDIILLKNG